MEYLDRFNINVQYETGKTYLVIEIGQPEAEAVYDYQVEMIASNPNPFILPFEVQRKDDRLYFNYDITPMMTLTDFLRAKGFSGKCLSNLVSGIAEGLLESRSLLLSERNFLYDERFVYVDKSSDRPGMVYLPVRLAETQDAYIKDFLFKLVSRTKALGNGIVNNTLDRAMEIFKAPDLNVKALCTALRSAATSWEGQTGQYELESDGASGNTLGVSGRAAGVVLPVKNTGKNEGASDRLVIDFSTSLWGFNLKAVTAALLSQLLIITAAVVTENKMRALSLDAASRYTAVGIFVMVFDFLFYRYIIKRLNTGGAKSGDNPGKLVKDTRDSACKPKNNILPGDNPNKIKSSSSDAGVKEVHMGELPGAGNEVLHVLDKKKGNRADEETTLLWAGAGHSAYIVYEWNDVCEKHSVDKHSFTIGRNPQISDLAVDDKAVGRLHAEIIQKGGEYFILDKNSKNGTYVNGERLTAWQEVKLNDGDAVMFASREYRFECDRGRFSPVAKS